MYQKPNLKLKKRCSRHLRKGIFSLKCFLCTCLEKQRVAVEDPRKQSDGKRKGLRMDAQCMNDKEDNLEHCNRNRRKANCLDR